MATTENKMNVKQCLSYRLTLLGLIGLTLALPYWLYREDFGWLAAIPGGAVTPLLLLFAVGNLTRNWSGITALCMIPLTVIGVMDIVADFTQPMTGMIIALLSITVFLAALDAGRRE